MSGFKMATKKKTYGTTYFVNSFQFSGMCHTYEGQADFPAVNTRQYCEFILYRVPFRFKTLFEVASLSSKVHVHHCIILQAAKALEEFALSIKVSEF